MNNSELVEQLMVQVKQNNALEDGIVKHIGCMNILCDGLCTLINKNDTNKYRNLNELVKYESAINAYTMLIKTAIRNLKTLLDKESNIIIDEEIMQ